MDHMVMGEEAERPCTPGGPQSSERGQIAPAGPWQPGLREEGRQRVGPEEGALRPEEQRGQDIFRYADDSFTPAFVSTVGIDFKVKTVYRHDKRIKLQIWDTAGQERYRTITTAYYRGAMGFLLMYDISNQESFAAVQDWATQIKTYSWDNAQVILVGNKCDLEDERVVPTEDGWRLANDLGFEFFEASAKENINVKQVFERLVDVICEKMNESLEASSSPGSNGKGPALGDPVPPQPSSCGC
ncbi:Ras-related protein Rab-3D [Heterocephalus glaber]|uniref:small monomeric GTPase n=1 Tax=Heterocephalus glaber TaxID=10181 RepID=G5BUJ0_HETGA|nr:Ras-related protein Rab-3D [Heterocephalus glaber]